MTLYNKIPADKIDPIGQAILNLYPHANIEGAVYPETNFRQVIVTDTFMYGFWGEGHTWPLESNPFPDSVTAENTFVNMFQHQQERWKKTPLVTNTQPDFSKVGNSELLDRTEGFQLAADRHRLH